MCLAVPGKILSIHGGDEALRMGEVSFGGTRRQISLAFVPEAKPGDYVLVHVGMAISLVDEEEAQAIFDTLREMGEALESEDDRLAGGA